MIRRVCAQHARQDDHRRAGLWLVVFIVYLVASKVPAQFRDVGIVVWRDWGRALPAAALGRSDFRGCGLHRAGVVPDRGQR